LEFVGNEQATQAQLRHLADFRNGTTIWSADLERVAAGVKRHPWVSAVRVERRFPASLVVRVEEYTPVALLAWNDGLYYVDDSGVPFLRARSNDLDYPVITGVDSALDESHPDLSRWALHDALWLVDQLESRDILARARVSEVTFSRSRGFTVHTTGAIPGRPTARILVGFGDYDRQLRHLAALVQQGVQLTEPLQVDVAPPSVAIVRPLDAV
jgi:hypothetical protein